LPEPWATRIVQDAHGVRLVDERELWPGHVFPNAVVAARGTFLREQGPLAARVTAAIAAEIERATHAGAAGADATADALGAILGKPLPHVLCEEAWRWVDFTADPLPDALETIAHDATVLGLAPATTCRTLFG
jgi:NitT/TauT family transport system substrate-binding protein